MWTQYNDYVKKKVLLSSLVRSPITFLRSSSCLFSAITLSVVSLTQPGGAVSFSTHFGGDLNSSKKCQISTNDFKTSTITYFHVLFFVHRYSISHVDLDATPLFSPLSMPSFQQLWFSIFHHTLRYRAWLVSFSIFLVLPSMLQNCTKVSHKNHISSSRVCLSWFAATASHILEAMGKLDVASAPFSLVIL